MNYHGTLRVRVARGGARHAARRGHAPARQGGARRARATCGSPSAPPSSMRRWCMLTALATMVGWVALGASWHDAIVTAIAVLIITCPCALGLAIPAVQVVAAGALFRSGVLLNSGDAIERLAEVDTIVFDKTGTLTLPEPEVVNAADIPPDTARARRPAGAGEPPSARRRGGARGGRQAAAGRRDRGAGAGRARRRSTASSCGSAGRRSAAPRREAARGDGKRSGGVRDRLLARGCRAMSSPCASACAPMRSRSSRR